MTMPINVYSTKWLDSRLHKQYSMVFITDKVSYSMVSLELILVFNVQTQSPGSMIWFDVQERYWKNAQATLQLNVQVQCT